MKEKEYNCERCGDRGRVLSPDGPWSDECTCQYIKDKDDEKKYYIVCYMRVRSEDMELMTKDQAKVEANQARLMQPENIYRIESIDDDDEHVVQ